MTHDPAERAREDMLLYRRDLCAKIDALLEVLHCDDIEDERGDLEEEATDFRRYVHRLRQWRTREERELEWADARVTEERECPS